MLLRCVLQNQNTIWSNNLILKHVSTQMLNFLPKRKYHDVQGDVICPNQVMGMSFIRDPRLNKGLAYSLVERQVLGIHGLLPPKFISQEEQLELCRLAIARYKENLNKYLYLNELHDDNEKLFYRLLTEDVNELMPIVYTPTVGLACLKFGLIYRRPRGIFITSKDKGYFYEILRNWPESNVRCICVTDGERILGLGDLGACGMGIPVGKLALYTALAGIPPHQCLPITLDVGTNNEEFLNDPLYIGLKQKRLRGKEYDEIVDEFMCAVVKRFGQNTLIQFEDFGFSNASRLLEKYRNLYCTFNDDIQGTASVVIAGFMTATNLTEKKKLSQNVFLFFGAGSAGLGCAKLLVSAMVREGVSVEEARRNILLIDAHGLITKNRAEKPIADQALFAVDNKDMKSLVDIIKQYKPNVLVGASAASKAFTPEVLKELAKINKRPIIFALSNPTDKAECSADDAYQHTEGRVIYASGSPMQPVQYQGKTYATSQGNNAYIFPGIALAVIATGIYHIHDELFLIAAEQLAQMVSQEDISSGKIYPPLSKIKEASILIASKIFQHAYKKGIATIYPEPTDIRHHIISQMYNYCYESVLPVAWKWNKSCYDYENKQTQLIKTPGKSIEFKPS